MSYVEAWAAAEKACFDYLLAALEGVENTNAFRMENIPVSMPKGQAYIWSFVLSGGPLAVQRQTRGEVTGGAWKMKGEWKCMCTTADLARRMAGKALNALPSLPQEIPAVARLYPVENPAIQRIVMPSTADADANRIFFEATIPMEAAFYNPPAPPQTEE